MERRIDVCAGRIFAFALVALFLLTAASVAQPSVQGHWTTLSYSMPNQSRARRAVAHGQDIGGLRIGKRRRQHKLPGRYLGSAGKHH